jgi:hypothetical protein
VWRRNHERRWLQFDSSGGDEPGGLSTRPGDLVIVTRTKDGLQEVTARRFQQNGTDCVLVFDSADSRFNGPALPVRSLAPNDQRETENNVLGGIVIGVYRPLMIS